MAINKLTEAIFATVEKVPPLHIEISRIYGRVRRIGVRSEVRGVSSERSHGLPCLENSFRVFYLEYKKYVLSPKYK